MSKKFSIFVSVIGIILGIVIIGIGLDVKDTSLDTGHVAIGEDIAFGADFYTEIYDVTRDVGFAVNSAKYKIVNGLESVCKAIGLLIVAVGLFDCCFFLHKLNMALPCNNEQFQADDTQGKRVAISKRAQLAEEQANLEVENDDSDDNYIEVICPECGESLFFEKNDTEGVCPYCNEELIL